MKPEGTFDGHPAYSTLAAFEAFTSTVIHDVASNPSLWRSTAIFVTEDEGGGYYDSGYVQPTSFFGDGTRVPMMAVSPWVNPGHIDHTYTDHVSVLKFIEANWGLTRCRRPASTTCPTRSRGRATRTCRPTGRRSATCARCSTSTARRAEISAQRVALLT